TSSRCRLRGQGGNELTTAFHTNRDDVAREGLGERLRNWRSTQDAIRMTWTLGRPPVLTV
ncbi:MAG: hypothetical protein VYA90_00320, partial [Acidobacteriota bacterium]|nr:hypothetical protein [Acidobacteriota bacterium]